MDGPVSNATFALPYSTRVDIHRGTSQTTAGTKQVLPMLPLAAYRETAALAFQLSTNKMLFLEAYEFSGS